MTRFALGTFDAGDGPFPGIVIDENIHDITAFTDYASTDEVLQDWPRAFDRLAAEADAPSTPPTAASAVRTLPPVARAGQIYGAGANYREHVIQMSVAHKLGTEGLSEAALAEEAARDIDERKANGEPYVWTGVPSAISGAYDDVVLPAAWDDHDWELELGVVIGTRAHHVSVDDALDHVAGYTICNDLTTRSLVPRKDIAMMGTDWMRAKNFPTFYPTGPWLVPAQFVDNPLDLGIRLSLNGKLMQDSNTGDMVFGPAELISYISRFVALEPGDMVITGSPPGNGSHWGRFLRPGDVMECEIDGLGTQRTECVRGD
ncbi:hydrolase [Rhodococcoides trifolii]|uniref:Hydrolase n=1 Tax=Rhodococcoides trifolii TaxID=908250 RepID=A0A917LII1_9NOCA|nr:fumarylacetoacetate hydrolase family protein [Rhodococcus trifolii]GGG26911.1 hydrolase [Rhodococcus trifolii]